MQHFYITIYKHAVSSSPLPGTVKKCVLLKIEKIKIKNRLIVHWMNYIRSEL